MQLTVRMPEEYSEKLHSLSEKLGLKRSDIVRLAVKRFLETDHEINAHPPFRKVEHLLGSVESGIMDLGRNHRRHLIQKIKRNE